MKKNIGLKNLLLVKVPFLLLSLLCNSAFSQSGVTKIAFGSCSHQDHDIPALDAAAKQNPDFFIFLGDNIYGDTKNMDTLRAKYARLARKESFQNLKSKTKILATWDDHDYGENDAGKKYKYKKESKEIFLDFFSEPAESDRRRHEGIYTAEIHELGGKKLQIILLDCRTFRDDLKKYRNFLRRKKGFFYDIEYLPHTNPTKTILGEQQWQWLTEQLKKPADLRLICSSTPFAAEFNGFEAWANFPHEQKKLMDLIRITRAGGVLFLSGDSHFSEVSKTTSGTLYPLYDITSSGLSSGADFAARNNNRIEGPVMENNFGFLTIDWNKSDPEIKMEIRDVNDNQRLEHTIKFSEISIPEK